jgi:tyrosyl-tRNA synthetase
MQVFPIFVQTLRLTIDSHGFLDSLKAPLELVEARAEYYKYTIQAMLEAVGVSVDKLEFVFGSSYQKTEKYVMYIN